jgi:myo-inositol-1(or 4)-monophosphatase
MTELTPNSAVATAGIASAGIVAAGDDAADTNSPAALRRVAEETARLAGAYLRTVFRGQMTIDTKRDRHDLVTEHDLAAEDIIVPHLLAVSPTWRVVGEEGGVRGSGDIVTWYVDPIDGTSNFAQGLAFFCVSIGAEIDGELVAGAIYDPIADRMYSADDAGAYLDGERLLTRTALTADAATVITGYPTAADVEHDGSRSLAGFGTLVDAFSSVRRTGSGALTLAHVAAGWVDSALGTSVNPWDVAAGALIVRRAGGTYRPLHYSAATAGTPDHMAPGFVAVGPGGDYPVLDALANDIEARRTRGAAR